MKTIRRLNFKNIKMLKLFTMLKQIVSQFEQICLKLGFKNDYTLTVPNFTRQFVPQKWSGAGKGVVVYSTRCRISSNMRCSTIYLKHQNLPCQKIESDCDHFGCYGFKIDFPLKLDLHARCKYYFAKIF